MIPQEAIKNEGVTIFHHGLSVNQMQAPQWDLYFALEFALSPNLAPLVHQVSKGRTVELGPGISANFVSLSKWIYL